MRVQDRSVSSGFQICFHLVQDFLTTLACHLDKGGLNLSGSLLERNALLVCQTCCGFRKYRTVISLSPGQSFR